MDANLERCRGLFSNLLRDAYAKNTTQDQCIGAAEAGAYLLAEIERLTAALGRERERCARVAENRKLWRQYSGVRPDADAIAMAIRDGGDEQKPDNA